MQLFAEGKAAFLGNLCPSLDGNPSILDIYANRDFLTVFPHHFLQKGRVLHRRCPQNHTEYACIQIGLDDFLGTDAAADLNQKPAFGYNRADGFQIGRTAVLRALQINHMEIFRPYRRKGARHCRRILAVYRFLCIIALHQTYRTAVNQINRRK